MVSLTTRIYEKDKFRSGITDHAHDGTQALGQFLSQSMRVALSLADRKTGDLSGVYLIIHIYMLCGFGRFVVFRVKDGKRPCDTTYVDTSTSETALYWHQSDPRIFELLYATDY